MKNSSSISINCSSSFSMTRPRYLTYLSVIIAAALAWLFFGDDCFLSPSYLSSLLMTMDGFLNSYREDLADDSDEALDSNKLLFMAIGSDKFCALWDSFIVLIGLTSDYCLQTAFTMDGYFMNIELSFLNLGARTDEVWTFWALVLLLHASCSSPTLVIVSMVGSEPDVEMSSILSSSMNFGVC